MICPHCSRDLLRRQRTGSRCTYCGKKFVFDPKTNRLKLHDMRVRKLAGKLSDDGRLRFTVTQLWYAAGRKSLTGDSSGWGCLLSVAAVFTLIVAAATGQGGLVCFAGPGLIIGVVLMVAASRRHLRRVPMPLAGFRRSILTEWVQTYGSGVPGLVDEARVAVPTPSNPRLGLVCPDPVAVACLAVNGILAQEAIVAVPVANALPPGLPAVILHDASPAGLSFAAQATAMLSGRRVVAAGLRPRTVLKAKAAVVLRERKPTASEVAGLRASGLEQAEIEWLANGFWSPLAASSPARIIGMVHRAAVRVTGPSQVERRRAKRVGFLSWPAA